MGRLGFPGAGERRPHAGPGMAAGASRGSAVPPEQQGAAGPGVAPGASWLRSPGIQPGSGAGAVWLSPI